MPEKEVLTNADCVIHQLPSCHAVVQHTMAAKRAEQVATLWVATAVMAEVVTAAVVMV
jgi:hypothetical protein